MSMVYIQIHMHDIRLKTIGTYLLSMMSVTTTSEAPIAFAVNTLTRPIGPAPQIRTFLPNATPALLRSKLKNVLANCVKLSI